MKKLVIPLLLASMCVLSGCAEKATQSDFKDRVLSESIEEKDYSIQVDSELKGDCYICGDNENSLMPYFRKSGMIGLVCLNTMDISNTATTEIYTLSLHDALPIYNGDYDKWTW